MAEFLLGDQTVAVLIPLAEEVDLAHLVLLQRLHDLLGHRNVRLQVDLEATQRQVESLQNELKEEKAKHAKAQESLREARLYTVDMRARLLGLERENEALDSELRWTRAERRREEEEREGAQQRLSRELAEQLEEQEKVAAERDAADRRLSSLRQTEWSL